jgi:hypothetical protein
LTRLLSIKIETVDDSGGFSDGSKLRVCASAASQQLRPAHVKGLKRSLATELNTADASLCDKVEFHDKSGAVTLRLSRSA